MGWAPPESKLSDNAGIHPGQDNVQIEGNYTIIRGSRVNISIILFCSLNYTMNNICATWSKCYSQSVHVVAFFKALVCLSGELLHKLAMICDSVVAKNWSQKVKGSNVHSIL